jgi:hypothetical protein
MKRLMVLALLAGAVVVVPIASATRATTVATSRGSGEFAYASVDREIAHAKAVYVQAIGRIDSVDVVSTCSYPLSSYRISQNSNSMGHAGRLTVTYDHHAESCDFTADASGSGPIKLALQVVR